MTLTKMPPIPCSFLQTIYLPEPRSVRQWQYGHVCASWLAAMFENHYPIAVLDPRGHHRRGVPGAHRQIDAVWVGVRHQRTPVLLI